MKRKTEHDDDSFIPIPNLCNVSYFYQKLYYSNAHVGVNLSGQIIHIFQMMEDLKLFSPSRARMCID